MNNLNYGVIGNCRTAALISQNGNIEWLCFPDFDSPFYFTSPLRPGEGKTFDSKFAGGYRVRHRSYVPHTNILFTQFSSDEGEFVVLNYLPPSQAKELRNENSVCLPTEIISLRSWIEGKITLEDQLPSGSKLCSGTR